MDASERAIVFGVGLAFVAGLTAGLTLEPLAAIVVIAVGLVTFFVGFLVGWRVAINQEP